MEQKKLRLTNPQDETVVANPRPRALRSAPADDATVAMRRPAVPADVSVTPARAVTPGTDSAAPVPIALPVGYRLHEYRIDSVLGQGGFGITYLATDVNLNAKVAIKEYLPEELACRSRDGSVTPRAAGDAETLPRRAWTASWSRRARWRPSATRNIVRVARFFEAHQHRLHGAGVRARRVAQGLVARARSRVAEAELLALLHPLLDGLAVVHDAGFLHRDIKPDNIYVRDDDGSLVLLDFGAARQQRRSGPEDAATSSRPAMRPIEQYAGPAPGTLDRPLCASARRCTGWSRGKKPARGARPHAAPQTRMYPRRACRRGPLQRRRSCARSTGR